MPIIKSAKKALRASLRKEKRNANQKKLLKEALRLVNAQNINATFSKIDKAAKNNIIHPNKAARFKAKLAKSVGVTPKATKAVAPKAKAKTATKKVATKKDVSKVAGKTPKRATKTAKAKTVKKEK